MLIQFSTSNLERHKKCCTTDVLNRFTINLFELFLVISLKSLSKRPWTNIVKSVQIFEHLDKLPSKFPLYEANDFLVLEPLLVAMVSDLWNHFCSFSV